MSHERETWFNKNACGVGRIRRHWFQLYVGDDYFDIDDLRNHWCHVMVEPALKKLDPPATALEKLWFVYFFKGLFGEREGIKMLMKL